MIKSLFKNLNDEESLKVLEVLQANKLYFWEIFESFPEEDKVKLLSNKKSFDTLWWFFFRYDKDIAKSEDDLMLNVYKKYFENALTDENIIYAITSLLHFNDEKLINHIYAIDFNLVPLNKCIETVVGILENYNSEVIKEHWGLLENISAKIYKGLNKDNIFSDDDKYFERIDFLKLANYELFYKINNKYSPIDFLKYDFKNYEEKLELLSKCLKHDYEKTINFVNNLNDKNRYYFFLSLFYEPLDEDFCGHTSCEEVFKGMIEIFNSGDKRAFINLFKFILQEDEGILDECGLPKDKDMIMSKFIELYPTEGNKINDFINVEEVKNDLLGLLCVKKTIKI